MNSCATILNRSHKEITIHTTEPSEISFNNHLIHTYKDKAIITTERNNRPIKIKASTDSLSKELIIYPRKSAMYWTNIFCNYGIGMLVDMNSQKKYSYPTRIYINSADTVGRYYKYPPSNNKGDVKLHISVPYINSFYMKPQKETSKSNTGFWGITAGLDYYHTKNQFLNVGVSSASDFFVPVPAAIDISGEFELMNSIFFTLSNNYKIKQFSLGYGLSFARNIWDFRFYDRFSPKPPSRDPVKKTHTAVGFIFPTYYQFGEMFNVGVIYRPTIFRPSLANKFSYEHLISVDFAYKIKLNR